MSATSRLSRPLRLVPVLLLLLTTLMAATESAPVAAAATTVVCPTCAVTSLKDAVAAARPGATIEVHGGVYPGELVIDRPLTLIGLGNPVIDGGGSGSLVRAKDAAVSIEGFTLRGTGTNHDQEDSAILVENGRATVVNNRIEDALFGIYLKNAAGSVVRDNIVQSKPLGVAMRGDGIKVWYSNDVLIEGNQASNGRDIILWYSKRGTVRHNVFDRGRYGLHLMFSDDATIENNDLNANSIGLYIMYSRNATVIGNSLSNNHGPSGGGIGLKDVNRALFEGNRFVNNQIGAQIDNSPGEIGVENEWKGNVFAFNEIGIGFLPSVQHNTLVANSFIDNSQHVSILGGGELHNITWAVDGRGNYWSDYAGFDANGDGIGDRPYRSQDLFESLTDNHPTLRLFRFSPAVLAIEFAARAFPQVQPETKLVDPAPLMSPPVSAKLPPVVQSPAGSRLALGLGGGALLGVVALALLWMHPRPVTTRRNARPSPEGRGLT